MTELAASLPIPAHPDYSVSPLGTVFYKGTPKPVRVREGMSAKLRFKINGTCYEFGLATLVAQLFIPNPEGHTRIIFIDGNNHNCNAGNIRWVSNSEFARYSILKNRPLSHKPRSQRSKTKASDVDLTKQPCKDPAAFPLPGYPGFYITPCGKVFRGNKLLPVQNLKSKRSPVVHIKHEGKLRSLGLAKLLAITFLPNPQNHNRIIFKDRNNSNCTLQNIAWASPAEFNAYTESFRTDNVLNNVADITEAMHPIPGFDGYFITLSGSVFRGNLKLKLIGNGPKRAPRVKLKTPSGGTIRITIPKLIAITFVPNPNNYPKIVFKDRNPQNFEPSNLEWVSPSQFASFVNSDRELDEVRKPKPVKLLVPDDPEAMEMEGFPGYYISPAGILYKRGRIIKPRPKGPNRSLQVRLRRRDWPPGKFAYFGLAKLLALYFIPNPKNHNYIIFKDRNNQNCVVNNIAWVDGETFAFYSGITKGGRKIVLTREEAIRKCTDPLIREYYKTLDESWLHDCWKELDKKVLHPYWQHYKSECYLYFWDRAKRFSLLKDPLGLMLAYCKGVRAKLRTEISPDIPASLLWKTDESLRNARSSKNGSSAYAFMNNFD